MRSLLFVAPALGGGGAEQHLVSLVHGLREVAPEIEVGLAVSRPGGALESRLPGSVRLNSLLSSGAAGSATWRTLRSVLPLRRRLRARRPDLVCALQDQSAVAALLATASLPRPPLVVVGVQNTLSRKYGAEGSGSRLLLRAMARLYPRADRLVVPSQGVADDLRSFWPRWGTDRHAPIEVIPNAVTQARPADSNLPRPRPPKLLVACGRLVPQKGFGDLLEAMTRLPDPGIHLWILGEGPLRETLLQRIGELGLEKRVWLAGFQNDPARFFAAADLFVLSSRWEGFGNVVVEALAAGAPVVATSCPHGPAEILAEGEFGRLVPPADPEALAEAVAALLATGEECAHLAAAGPRRAADFAAPVIARRYLDLFHSLPKVGR